MGKIIIEKWKCDRCGEIHDKRPYYSGGTWEVSFSKHYSDGPGPSVSWKELCPKCNIKVENVLNSLFES